MEIRKPTIGELRSLYGDEDYVEVGEVPEGARKALERLGEIEPYARATLLREPDYPDSVVAVFDDSRFTSLAFSETKIGFLPGLEVYDSIDEVIDVDRGRRARREGRRG